MSETSGSSKKTYVLIKLRTSWLISTRTNGLISRKCLVKNRPSVQLGWGEIHGLGTQPRAGGGCQGFAKGIQAPSEDPREETHP